MAVTPYVGLTTVRWVCLLVIFFSSITYSESSTTPDVGCAAVRKAYASKGFERHDVPDVKSADVQLEICPRGITCCTRQMEHKLSAQSRQDFDDAMASKINLLRQTFISRTAKFDAFFTELLDNAKRDLHDMFVQTYGLLYQQNANVFTDLFHDLRSYYKGKDIDLLDALDHFFTTLLRKMFVLLNSQYTFDKAYFTCLTKHMDKLKPFGDVPEKLSKQVKRSFIAARTFVQGLAVGRDVILAVSKLSPTAECSRAFMRTTYCPYCEGMPQLKPCNNFCMNVMKGCLAYHADLNDEWNRYIDALMKLATRLEGPFNIEAVVEPINVKISDAIMNYQENSEIVSTKIFQGCGQPRLGDQQRRRRAATELRDVVDDGYQWKREPVAARPTTAAGTSLDRLVRDIRDKVALARNFWKGLPDEICTGLAAPVMDVHNCWNGNEKARYMPEVVADGVRHQEMNPEVEVDVRRPNAVLNDLLYNLRVITNKLGNAHNGVDVDWLDTDGADGSDSELSGSGSGSGSGYEIDTHYDGEISFTPVTHRPPVINTHHPGVGMVPRAAAPTGAATCWPLVVLGVVVSVIALRVNRGNL